MIEKIKTAWRERLLNNIKSLRRVCVFGSVLICVSSVLAYECQNIRRRSRYERSIQSMQENAETIETYPYQVDSEDPFSQLNVMSAISLGLVFAGHSLSRWAAKREGVLSASQDET